MGNYEQLKAAITAAIKSNGNQEITGAILQSILLSIVNTIGSGAVFRGVATPSTNPGSQDGNSFYLAGTAGTYSNFGGFILDEGLAVLQNSSGNWTGTKILSIISKADTDNIGGARRLKYSQAPLINLYNVEPISACTENNKLWYKTDGRLYYRQAGTDYNLGTPAYSLYYNGNKIYKWNGSGFTEMSSGSGEPASLDFNTGESVEDISLFSPEESLDNKSDAQLALMIPTGAVIKALLDAIDSIDTSGGTYDGVDQVVTFSFVASTRVLTLKQSGRTAKTITLPLASTSSPGLMSAQDKTDLNNAKNKIVSTLAQTTYDGNLVVTVTFADGDDLELVIPNGAILNTLLPNGVNPITGSAVSNYLTDNYVSIDADTLAYADKVRILPLVSMGSELDGGQLIIKQTNDFWYNPSTKRIIREGNTSQPWFNPRTKQLYLNVLTGNLYKWTGTDMVQINAPSGGGSTELPSTIIETEENGFFLVDDNLNIGGFATLSGSNIITSSIIGESSL